MTFRDDWEKWHSGDRPVCCVKCFSDPVLRRTIRAAGTVGTCSWCESTGVKVIPVEELQELFREAARLYVTAEDEHGDFLGDLFEEDWEIFGPVFEEDSIGRNALTSAILGGLSDKDDLDTPDYSVLFSRTGGYSYDLEDSWEAGIRELIEGWQPGGEIKRRTRTLRVGKVEIEVDDVAFALEHVAVRYKAPPHLYRARIHRDRGQKSPFGPADMGAPPAEKASAGRANREGQPVLYLASDQRTAVAEVRPWRSAAVAVAQMKLRDGLFIGDLRKLARLTSPFGIEGLDWYLQARGLLRRFGQELATPVSPHDSELVYLPSQDICEAVRAASFDGLAYPSSLGSGHNVVLFDPAAASPTNVEYVRVKHVRYGSESLSGEEINPDDWGWS